MKRCLVAALAVCAASAAAQRPLRVGLAGGGTVMAPGQLDHLATRGTDFAASLSYASDDLPFVFRLEGAYDRFPLKRAAGGDIRSIALIGNYLIDLPRLGASTPYLLAGIGMYNSKAPDSVSITETGRGRTDVGLNAGAGLRAALGPVDGFVEVRYHHVYDVGLTFAPLMIGIRL